MAQRKTAAALAEASGEAFTPEETQLMADNQAAEHEAPEESEAAPAVEAQKEPAPAAPEAEAQPEIDPATGKQRKVDYGALHAEREKRKAAETARQDTEKQLATVMGRFSVLEQLAKQTQPKADAAPSDEIPDINVDPVGHFRAKNEIAERRIASFEKWQQTQEANATAMNNVQRLTQIALSHEAEFGKKTPDYQDAAGYVRNVRDQELQAMGYNDPGVRQQIITNDAIQIAAQALQNNMNAAEVVYNIAKARGWTGKKAVAAPAIDPTKAPDAVKIATVAAGQKQGSPLSEANGAAMPPTSPEAIAKMSDAEFAKWATDENWRKLFA